MSEVMYDQSSILIAGVLLVSMVMVIELGFRIGSTIHVSASDSSRNQINAVQASLLGILALLLSFTLSQALERYDNRSEAVVAEANAIGTAYLRAQLLPESIRPEVTRALREYLDMRVRASAISLDRRADREKLLREVNRSLNGLWRKAVQAVATEPNPVTTGLFAQALNDVIDSYGTRDAALSRHIPEVVLFLLYGSFLMTGCIVGYASGVAGHRATFATYILVGLIVLLVFIIIDLDRPRRGLIEVSQKSLVSLHEAIVAGEWDASTLR